MLNSIRIPLARCRTGIRLGESPVRAYRFFLDLAEGWDEASIVAEGAHPGLSRFALRFRRSGLARLAALLESSVPADFLLPRAHLRVDRPEEKVSLAGIRPLGGLRALVVGRADLSIALTLLFSPEQALGLSAAISRAVDFIAEASGHEVGQPLVDLTPADAFDRNYPMAGGAVHLLGAGKPIEDAALRAQAISSLKARVSHSLSLIDLPADPLPASEMESAVPARYIPQDVVKHSDAESPSSGARSALSQDALAAIDALKHLISVGKVKLDKTSVRA